MDSFRRSTSIIFTNPPAGAGRSSKKVFISGIYIPHRPAHYDHGCGETNYSAQSQTQKNKNKTMAKAPAKKTTKPAAKKVAAKKPAAKKTAAKKK